MLAERKSKMRWGPNPCGNLWAKDTSKFGQKILEKFGWSPGKGLGSQEQGITAPVRLKCNSTQKGLGYDRGKAVHIFKHQEEFNSILNDLNFSESSSSDGNAKISLEEKSKSCKTRVHYHKFTRGKDLSRYSDKDLSCILGGLPTTTLEASDILVEENVNETVSERLISPLIDSIKDQSIPLKSDDKNIKKKKKKKKYSNLEQCKESENEVDFIIENEFIHDKSEQNNDEITTKDNFTLISGSKHKKKHVKLEEDILDRVTSKITKSKKKRKHATYENSESLLDINETEDTQVESNMLLVSDQNRVKKNKIKL